MSDPHQDSEAEPQYRANVQPKKPEDKNKHPPKYNNGDKLLRTLKPDKGSIQVIVQERRATEKPDTGGWEYKVKDPDTGVSFAEWYPQNILTWL